MPIMIAAGIGAAGSLASGLLGFFGSQDASKAQANAASNSLAFQKDVWNTNKANAQPWITSGQGANYTLANLYGIKGVSGGPDGATSSGTADYSSFTKSPDYKFAFDQGQNATTNLLSAKGDLMSGTGLTGLTSWGQGLATQQYQNYFGRLLQLSQMGQSSSAALAGTGVATGNQVGASYGALGQAQASGAMGGANALASGIGGAANAATTPFYLNMLASMKNSANNNMSSYVGNTNYGNGAYGAADHDVSMGEAAQAGLNSGLNQNFFTGAIG